MLKFKKIKGNLIHPTAIINWKKVTLGKNNTIGPYAVIGMKAQWKDKKSTGKIIIGDNNFIHEYCNIHLPTNITKKTQIGNNNYFMNSTTIDHDCYIEDNVQLNSNVILGGNVTIMKNSQLGMKVIIHQGQIIGSYSMIGMGSIITRGKKIEPGYIYYGKPVRKIRKNIIGLKRNKISSDILKKEYKRFLNYKKNEKNSNITAL